MTKMRQWSLMTVVAVLVVFVAGWFLLVKPQKSKVADLKSQASEQNSENQTILTKIAALQSEQRQLPAQQLALQKFSTEVPDTANEPTLIRQLSTAAQGAGVNLISMTPGTAAALTSTGTATPGSASLASPGASASLTALPVSLGVIGSYANLESFYQSLEKLPRAIVVNAWDMCQVATTSNGGGSASSNSGSGSGGCTTPSVPSNLNPPTGTLGATLTAEVFYAAPPASTQTAGATSTGAAGTTTTGSTGTTTTPGTTTPSTAPTTAATTAASTAATSATTS